MGRWDADAAQLFGWDEATQARVAARKQAKRPTTGKKYVPVVKEVDWRTTAWRENPWQYQPESEKELIAEHEQQKRSRN